MAKPIVCKCKQCKNEIEKDKAFVVKGEKRDSYFCNEECSKEFELKKVKSKKEENKPKSDRVELTDYIQKLYGKSCNFPMMMMQVGKMQKEFGFTDKGIQLT